MQHLIDTDIKGATCNRCGAWVYSCTVSGVRVAAEPWPLDLDGYRAALRAGRACYDQQDQAGRPWRLRARTASSSWPPYAGRSVLAEHGCGAQGQDARGVTEIHPQSPGASGSAIQTPAPGGANPRTEGIWRCDACKCIIKPDEYMIGIEYGSQRWAVHDPPCVKPKKVPDD